MDRDRKGQSYGQGQKGAELRTGAERGRVTDRGRKGQSYGQGKTGISVL